jgi:hypothetical protein
MTAHVDVLVAAFLVLFSCRAGRQGAPTKGPKGRTFPGYRIALTRKQKAPLSRAFVSSGGGFEQNTLTPELRTVYLSVVTRDGADGPSS